MVARVDARTVAGALGVGVLLTLGVAAASPSNAAGQDNDNVEVRTRTVRECLHKQWAPIGGQWYLLSDVECDGRVEITPVSGPGNGLDTATGPTIVAETEVGP